MSSNPDSEADLQQGEATYTCPNCGTTASTEVLAAAEYRCGQCGLEVAHVPTTALGPGHGVVHWLRHPGDVILERYQIERVLGKGGFAATYLVQDRRVNGKRRALKEIPESLYDATETELLSKLSHPSIPDITDQARSDGMVYLVLELGGGRTLESERKLAGGKVPLGRVLPWLTQLGAALTYLHGQHPPIIHRDLKPDNVLLDEHGRIMLIDFGIAKQSADSGQTRILARAATHGFSPPEQAMGTGTDPRSDVYALAATAYNLVTGVVPTAAHERIAGKELADPIVLVPELPASMGAALLQALNLNINHRPATVEQFLHQMGLTGAPAGGLAATSRTVMVGELGAAAESQATSVRIRSERVTVAPALPPVRRSRHVGLWAVTGVVIAALAGAGIWFYQGRETAPTEVATIPEPSKEAPPTVPAPPQRPTMNTPGATGAPAPQTTAGPPDMVNPNLDVRITPLAPPTEPTSSTPDGATARGEGGSVVLPATDPALPLAPSQEPATTAALTSDSSRSGQASMGGGSARSAMDVFEKRRTTALAEEPEPVVNPPDEPDRVVRKPAKPKRAPAPSGGNSGWTGIYIGGSKRD